MYFSRLIQLPFEINNQTLYITYRQRLFFFLIHLYTYKEFSVVDENNNESKLTKEEAMKLLNIDSTKALNKRMKLESKLMDDRIIQESMAAKRAKRNK